MNEPGQPLVILGMDGADHRLLLRWAGEGYLPTFSSLIKKGCWARVAGPDQLDEHGTDLTFLSGVSRAHHGYYHYRQLEPGTYDLRPYSAVATGVLPFWSRLVGTSKKVAILDAAESRIVPGLDGIQLLNWATHQPAIPCQPACSDPPDLLKRVRRIFGPQMPLCEYKIGDTFANAREDLRVFLKRVEKKGALLRALLKEGHFDLIVAGFFEAHTGGHRYWGYLPERQPPGTPENELTHALRSIYEAIDRQMGLLLAELPPQANVFIYSPFGNEDHYPKTELIQNFFHRLGYQAVPPPAKPSMKPVALLRRLLPENLRIRISHYLPAWLQEKLLAEQFRTGSDWTKTTAFTIPSLYTSFIFVNLHGREPQGIVQPGEEYERVVSDLEADLRSLTDPETGTPAVKVVTCIARHFGLKTPPKALPDILVEWTPSRRFLSRAIHPRGDITQRRPGYFRCCHHFFEGFFVAAGPSIRGKGDLGCTNLLDMAPTFLRLLGQEAPADWTGEPMKSLV